MKKIISIILSVSLCSAMLAGISVAAESEAPVAPCQHEPEISSCIEPTCTEDGYFGATYCRLCGEKLAEGQTIPALGHDWDEGYPIPASVADMCNYDLPHTWIFTCKRCGEECREDIPAEGCPSRDYIDVGGVEKWYHNAVDYVIRNGYMQSTDAEKPVFAPDATASRAMIVQILYNYAGNDEKCESYGFTDVPDGKWFSDAVNWAAANGIVSGTGAGKFSPNDSVTREQFAAILYRFANLRGIDTGIHAELPDGETISEWAKFPFSWAIAAGILHGNDKGEFNPLGKASRAEVATMLMCFVEIIEKAY